MLRFFRKNDPYRLVPIFLILVIIRVAWLIVGLPGSDAFIKWELLGYRLSTGVFMYRDVYDYTGPLAAGTYRWIVALFGTSVWPHFILSTFLVIFQAGFLNVVLLRNKAFEENNYLPAFLYVIIQSSLPGFYILSPQLLSVTFLILALNLIFRRIDNMASDDLFLQAGLFVGIALLFYLGSVMFFLSFLISFILYSTAILRRVILFIIGMMVPIVVVWAYTYWFDYHWDFLTAYFIDGLLKPKTYFTSYTEFFGAGYSTLIIFSLSVLGIFWFRLTNFQTKIVQVMLFFLLASAAAFLLSPELTGAEYAFILPPMAFLTSHLLLNLKRRIIRVVVPYIIVLVIILTPFFREQPVLKTYRPPKDAPALMLIGTEYSKYEGYRIASPFLDEYVSKKRIEGLDYYDTSSEIYSTLLKDQPERVIDQWGLWKKFEERFPQFVAQYRPVGNGIYERISN